MPTKLVVSAAIVNRKMKRMLLARRSPDTSYPLHWCTPGGLVEEGESIVDALKREICEELLMTVSRFSHVRESALPVYVHDIESTKNPGQTIRVMCLLVFIEEIYGPPSCGDKTIGVCWFDAEELRTLKFAAADDANREALIRAIESL